LSPNEQVPNSTDPSNDSGLNKANLDARKKKAETYIKLIKGPKEKEAASIGVMYGLKIEQASEFRKLALEHGLDQ
jgi:hypothetical protein